MKVWQSTLTLLKVISAMKGKSMVKTLHLLVKVEADKMGAGVSIERP